MFAHKVVKHGTHFVHVEFRSYGTQNIQRSGSTAPFSIYIYILCVCEY